jgi:UrcA family protein
MSPIGRTAARWLFSVAVLAGVGLAADVTLADGPMPSTSIRLQLTKHALDTPQGVAMTYRRIRNAARSVCGQPDRVLPQEQADWDDCVAATIRHTVTQIGSPKLTDFLLMKSGAPRSD